MKELASAVTRADAVVFPVDCISHGAANKVKRLCQQSLKPFITLRTSGIGSLIAGLKKWPAEFAYTLECNKIS